MHLAWARYMSWYSPYSLDLAMLHVSLHGVQWISGEKEGALETLQRGIDRFGQTGIARHLLMVSRAHGELALGRQGTCRETVEHTRFALRASTQKAMGSLIARDLDVLEAQLCLLQVGRSCDLNR
jgi:hypothetical protein